MTMTMDIKDQYIEQFKKFLDSLPNDAVIIKNSLDEEIDKRVKEYKNDTMKTTPFGTGLDKIREKIESQI